MLKLDNLHFKYNEQHANYDFSLQAKAASITAISGRSGSGKSTLLDLIAGFLLPTAGSITWKSRDITTLSPDKRPITILFQKNNLFEHRSAVDNVVVGVNPSIPRHGADVEQAKKALDSVNLSDYYDQRASTLSGGQQQRVAIARASIRRQGILLLDEPFSALDRQTKMQMLALVRNLADLQKSAVIMVTHDLADAEAIADYHFELIDGKLVLCNV